MKPSGFVGKNSTSPKWPVICVLSLHVDFTLTGPGSIKIQLDFKLSLALNLYFKLKFNNSKSNSIPFYKSIARRPRSSICSRNVTSFCQELIMNKFQIFRLNFSWDTHCIILVQIVKNRQALEVLLSLSPLNLRC